MFCDGQILSAAAYPRLFAVLGKSAGGNGKTTFALPRASFARFIIAVNGAFGVTRQAIANVRRGEFQSPDVSVPGLRVLARPAR